MRLTRFTFAVILTLGTAGAALAQQEAVIAQTGEAEMFREAVLGVAGAQSANALVAAREGLAYDGAVATVTQDGLDHEALIDQAGDGLYAEIVQEGAADGPNVARIDQDGLDLLGIIHQIGSQNAAELFQAGHGHTAVITQQGAGNTATVVQSN